MHLALQWILVLKLRNVQLCSYDSLVSEAVAQRHLESDRPHLFTLARCSQLVWGFKLPTSMFKNDLGGI